MAAYRRVDGFKSPAAPPVHRGQLRAQRSLTSMGSIFLDIYVTNTQTDR